MFLWISLIYLLIKQLLLQKEDVEWHVEIWHQRQFMEQVGPVTISQACDLLAISVTPS